MFQYQASEKTFNCFDSKFCDNVQIPSLPLKGPKPFDQILHCIHKAIEDEANAVDYYRHLLKDAPNKLHCEFLQQICDNELEHLHIFIKLYIYYTDCEPKYCVTPACIKCYREGLLKALTDELATVTLYRNVQLSTMDQVIIDTFYMVMIDEQSHATMLSTLFNNFPCK
ncbi:ferritin-like domain-containing protein [Mobilitalea sibirica]|uniref:Ferritin-like domain-containing protein n=1 Tax=Mobilitalea sibirica TaxID=1462919 RepID=A0A8J7HBJ8_9FIRM|nr:ferritin-like domain-containing protein [Mobilitalea sibirica]MBH1939304.1 ferritin-like domain-containing protein [Mobilitalea sibirica]